MTEYEKLGAFYLGKTHDLEQKKTTGPIILYDAKDLTTHAVIIGMTSPETVYHEALNNFEVILLLIFMVAGIFFMKDFLQFTFTRLLVAPDEGHREGVRGWQY